MLKLRDVCNARYWCLVKRLTASEEQILVWIATTRKRRRGRRRRRRRRRRIWFWWREDDDDDDDEIYRHSHSFIVALCQTVGWDSIVGLAIAMSWAVRRSNPSGIPSRPALGIHLACCTRVLFLGGNAAKTWGWPHPPPSRVEVKERVELYL